MPNRKISEVDPYDRKRVQILDRSYFLSIDVGVGDPVVFLHEKLESYLDQVLTLCAQTSHSVNVVNQLKTLSILRHQGD